MLVSADLAQPVAFPAAEEPSPAEQQALAALVTAAEQAFVAALAPLCAVPVTATGQWQLLEDEPGCDPGVRYGWRQEALQWWLALPLAAGECLLAGFLGQEALEPRETLSATDVALLQAPLAEVARRVSARLGAAEVSAVEVCPAGRLIAGPCEEPALAMSVELAVGRKRAVVTLLTRWTGLRRQLGLAERGQRLPLQALEGAPVTLCAEMRGPTLTVRDLLDLQPGDVVRLGPADGLVDVSANGSPFARGKAGARGDRLAINLREVMPLWEDANDSQ